MKLARVLALAAIVTAFALPAQAEWTKSESFEFSSRTSLKLVSAAHGKALVKVDGVVKEETLPAIFPLPDHDAYVEVKIVADDGDTWSGKIEVKAHKQTIVQLTHVPRAAAPAAPPAAVHKYIGRLVNGTDTCRASDRVDKFVVMKDGKPVLETSVPPNRAMSNVELDGGTYTVRIFRKGIFVAAKELVVSKDGWIFTYGC
ncbi:MAG: hypothetical protein IPF92_22060 [Myxococcales bacterium]|jgi:hypothetical protein|nr:hypothetical protein [Myxococcales bacterium]MBL0194526.1 hypothetical protein [Myxococcales bacterium]